MGTEASLMSTLAQDFITPEKYLEIERKAEAKSEHYRGEMFAMSGGERRTLQARFRVEFPPRNPSPTSRTRSVRF